MPAIPSIVGFAGSGGVTLYKKSTEGPKLAEFVLIKFEIHHDIYTLPQPAATK